jgi:hypothetical protein
MVGRSEPGTAAQIRNGFASWDNPQKARPQKPGSAGDSRGLLQATASNPVFLPGFFCPDFLPGCCHVFLRKTSEKELLQFAFYSL